MFRLDRFLTLHFFSALMKHRPFQRSEKIPVLMYHAIGCPQKADRHPYYETATSPTMFAAHMEFLKNMGYRAVGLVELLGVLFEAKRLLDKIVMITFDDGLADFKSAALPILKRHGFRATVFLPAELVGGTLKGQRCLTWADVRESAASGTEFGSHSLTHFQLTLLDAGGLERELRVSKETIEEKIGKKVEGFSFPYAFPEYDKKFIDRLEKLLEACGYRAGVTTIVGRASAADGRFRLKRIPVNTHDDIQFFRAKLEGAYDWLAWPQRFKKRLIGLSKSGT